MTINFLLRNFFASKFSTLFKSVDLALVISTVGKIGKIRERSQDKKTFYSKVYLFYNSYMFALSRNHETCLVMELFNYNLHIFTIWNVITYYTKLQGFKRLLKTGDHVTITQFYVCHGKFQTSMRIIIFQKSKIPDNK